MHEWPHWRLGVALERCPAWHCTHVERPGSASRGLERDPRQRTLRRSLRPARRGAGPKGRDATPPPSPPVGCVGASLDALATAVAVMQVAATGAQHPRPSSRRPSRQRGAPDPRQLRPARARPCGEPVELCRSARVRRPRAREPLLALLASYLYGAHRDTARGHREGLTQRQPSCTVPRRRMVVSAHTSPGPASAPWEP